GGLIAQRLTMIPGSSDVFRGSVVTYASDLKAQLLDAPEGPSVSEETAEAMALGVCQNLGVDVSVATTGVAGPGPWEGIPPGTIWVATCVDGVPESTLLRYNNTDRTRTRQYTTITVLNLLRRRLLER
ncbi:MAG: CinA family protein, partial [Acidimicrobiales bacterium]